MDFYDLDLEDCVLDALDAMNFQETTPVQEKTIPVILDGHDLIGVAQTGTGKTAAYLLPVLNMLCQGGYPTDSVNCLIMAPTRELVQQIDQAMQGFSYFMPISSVAVYGGNDGIRYAQELRSMEMGADIVIATPGRLISHISLGNIDLSKVSFFILDEADRMLDMGFYDDIMQIVKALPKDRQTIMFSATMPKEIQALAKTILQDPVEVKIAVSKPAEKIHQSAYICHEAQKIRLIQNLFKEQKPERVMIFAGKKQLVKDLARSLRRINLDVAEMHSDLTQPERDDVMLRFKNNRVPILVATDIVSRGIDIDDITLVINYNVPQEAEDYVHRIGRTARANRDGRAITFVNQEEQRQFLRIEKFLGKTVEKLPVPAELGEAPEYTGNKPKTNKDTEKKKDKHKNNKNNKPKPKGKEKITEPKPTETTANNAETATVEIKEKQAQKKRRKHHKKPEQAQSSTVAENKTAVPDQQPITTDTVPEMPIQKKRRRPNRRKPKAATTEIPSKN